MLDQNQRYHPYGNIELHSNEYRMCLNVQAFTKK